ncbi:cysteine-rich receptor-like protein kinase 6 [Cryptomeria japonica]|uniref:cysteine-rich receptor-like protein kinase 6 n=1 Tax=Cryptomeria japonica TaxID=3369 RepID=UPI0027D9D06F|nr:cysteine-rich receptor-like protein kinase 6 [Cryptomeria japonica]
MSASCIVRFEIYPFVESGNLSSSPSPSPEASSPPPTTSHTSSPPVALGPSEPTSQGKSNRHAFSPQSGLRQQEQRFILSLGELAESNENFHDNNKLGEGGFSSGTTKDGKQIAVKKLSAKSRQGKEEFMNEVKLMANVEHRNLVKLLGCRVEGDERSKKRRLLDWEKRYNIIIGVARGLLYLHEDS